MSEGSQSRYSIVREISFKKMELLEKKSHLDSELQDITQNIIEEKKQLEAFKTDEEENKKRSIRGRERRIEQLVALQAYKTKQKNSEVAMIDLQIKELDKALKSIEEISRTAPTPEENK